VQKKRIGIVFLALTLSSVCWASAPKDRVCIKVLDLPGESTTVLLNGLAKKLPAELTPNPDIFEGETKDYLVIKSAQGVELPLTFKFYRASQAQSPTRREIMTIAYDLNSQHTELSSSGDELIFSNLVREVPTGFQVAFLKGPCRKYLHYWATAR
jgi:hypothetical protein